MMLTRILIAAIVVLLIALGIAGFLLKHQYELNGQLRTYNEQLTQTIEARQNAMQGRAKIESDVRKLAPADKRERLR